MVSEGVETVEQHEFLAANGCDYLQGYLLSRPVPLADLRPILERLDRQEEAFSACCDTALPGSPDLFADNPGYRAGASIARRGH
ncbi:phage resistance protein [compost metagenome]